VLDNRNKYPNFGAPLDVLSKRKFIIGALSRGRFDNHQWQTYGINGDWNFNNFAQTFANSAKFLFVIMALRNK
jgi:hypothetical protein